MSWISPASVRSSGVGTPAAAPISATSPICESTSVRRLRTDRSRQIPEWVFALRRRMARSASSEASVASGGAPGAKAAGSNPPKPTGTTPRARATATTSRASAANTGARCGSLKCWSIGSSVSAVA